MPFFIGVTSDLLESPHNRNSQRPTPNRGNAHPVLGSCAIDTENSMLVCKGCCDEINCVCSDMPDEHRVVRRMRTEDEFGAIDPPLVESTHGGQDNRPRRKRKRGQRSIGRSNHARRSVIQTDLHGPMILTISDYPWGSVIEKGSRAAFRVSISRTCWSTHNSRIVLPEAKASLASLAAFS